MSVDPVQEQVRLYAKQLKLPAFTRYPDILHKARPDTRFDELLLELMKAETEQRKENQNRKRLRAASFPYTKTLEELDLSRYDGNLSDLFLGELASCKFISEKKNVVMIGNPGRGKTHMAIGLGLKASALGLNNLPFGSEIRMEAIANQLAERFALPYDQARKLTNVKLKRMADRGEIERFQKGMYFHVKETVFGKVTPDIDQMVMETLMEQDGAKIGYESGASLFNGLGLTTMIPRDIAITTNRYRTKLPERCHIKVRRPPTVVTDQNWKYLQLIDVVSMLPNAHIDADHPEQLLAAHIKNRQLDGLTLILTARRYYPQKVVLQVIDLLELIHTPHEIDTL